MGGGRAYFCPECRKERQKEQNKRCKERRRAGTSRQLGSTDICKRCGSEYVVSGGLQQFCPECSKNVELERNRKRALDAYNGRREQINAERTKQRKDNSEIKHLLKEKPITARSSEKNIIVTESGRFRVTCYHDNIAYYLGTWPTMGKAISARDGFALLLDDGATASELKEYKSSLAEKRTGIKQASYKPISGVAKSTRKEVRFCSCGTPFIVEKDQSQDYCPDCMRRMKGEFKEGNNDIKN